MAWRSARAIGVAASTVLLAVTLAGARGTGDAPAARSRAADQPSGGWRVAPASDHAVEGYTSTASVAPGDTLELHVATTPARSYRVEIFRIGWYGSAGGGLVGCIPACDGSVAGASRRLPRPDDRTGEANASWPVTDRITVGPDWRSGFYVAKLVLVDGPEAGRGARVPFVVRAAATARPSRVLVVEPVNTWQAYNDWAGRSLYTDPKPAVRVSFDRPYAPGLDKPYLDWPLLRFLDRYRYDVSYTTDADIDADPGQLRGHRLVIVPAHSEYWTKAMRDGFEAARAAGVNLAFLGGNTAYWQIRYAGPGRRALVEFRSAERDPSSKRSTQTVRWRDAPVSRPECTLLGVQWQGADRVSDPGPHDYRVTAAAAGDPWLRGTGLVPGSVLRGAVDYEWDAVEPACKVPPVTVLFHYAGKKTPHPAGVYTSSFHSTDADAVRYVAPSGAVVFSAGSIDFRWLLAGGVAGSTDPRHPPDPRARRFVRTMLDDLVRDVPLARTAARGR